MKIKEITAEIEKLAPLSLQESYDNSGYQVGNPDEEAKGALLCFDVTPQVVNEAIQKNCNLIISHHPLIFHGLKKIIPQSDIQRSIILALQNNVTIYSAHTNIDNAEGGMNAKIAEKIGLLNCEPLCPMSEPYLKLVTYVPEAQAESVRNAIFAIGGGCIGNYDSCSYSQPGEGTFRANADCHPFVGTTGELHTEDEIRLEIVLPSHLRSKATIALLKAHPYEEPAFDFYPLEKIGQTGTGAIGYLKTEMTEIDFLNHIKQTFNIPVIRHTQFLGRKIRKVAFVGGAGSSFLYDALAKNADVFLTSDIKYHDFFNAENRILFADFGHFESEQYIKETFFDIIRKKFPIFVTQISDIVTNPINYL